MIPYGGPRSIWPSVSRVKIIVSGNRKIFSLAGTRPGTKPGTTNEEICKYVNLRAEANPIIKTVITTITVM